MQIKIRIHSLFFRKKDHLFYDILNNNKEKGIEFITICETHTKEYCIEIHEILEPYNLNWIMCDWNGMETSCALYEEYPVYSIADNGIMEQIGTGMKNIKEIKEMFNC